MQQTAQRERILPTTPPQSAASQTGIALQLGLSYLISSASALGVYLWLLQSSLQQPYPLLITLATACVVGLLCTLNLQYSLYLLELTLARLAHGLPIASVLHQDAYKRIVRRWPLGALFARLEEAAKRVQRYAEHEQLTTDLREKALQQASETAAQAERNRIARELHDSIKQQIFSISMSAASAKAFWQGEDAGEAREAVEDIQRSAKEAQIEMQALLQQLRPAPLENTSLVEALRIQAQALGFRTGAQVHSEIGEMPGNERLLPGTQEAIFRLVQEAFANIAKHARAQTVWLTLHADEQRLHIEVRDDGQGFALASAQKGMGLNNLSERAGELHGTVEIGSQPGEGTRVAISIPLLDSLRSPAEEERARYELARAIELARRGYQLCENTSLLGIFLIVLSFSLSIHWSIIALCVLAAVYGYASGSYYRAQVALNAGPESRDALELAHRQYPLSLNLVRLLGFGLWYALILTGSLQFATRWWMIIALAVSLVGFSLLTRRRRYHNSERYYYLLSTQELRWELERRRQRLTRSLSFWVIGISIYLAFIHVNLEFPPITAAQWSIYGLAVIALFLATGMFSDYLQLQRWQQMLTGRAQQPERGSVT